jgi:hypothetical protein
VFNPGGSGVQIQDKDVVVEGRLLKTIRLEDEWCYDVSDPKGFEEAVRSSGVKADLISFWQRIPESTAKFDYFTEWEDLAVLPVETYDEWWNNRIKSRTRGLIRKTEKMGVTIRETQFDDEFVRGMVEIFNESPVRQGRPFWHYGKTFETVKKDFSRYLFREDIVGAYHQDKMIGFVMLANAGPYTYIGQILSKIEHRDKAPNNALIAKAIEITARRQIPYLVYNYWNETGLTEFKRRNGFEKRSVPRYFVPLTAAGRLGLSLGVHRSAADILPKTLVLKLKQLRAAYYARKQGGVHEPAVAQGD